MFEARTAWAIALLLAPTGIAAAVAAPAQHTVYVELVIEEEPEREDVIAVEARVDCQVESRVHKALDYFEAGVECRSPAGASIYVSNADAQSPLQAEDLRPTGKIYLYEDETRVWTVREFTYTDTNAGSTHHTYLLSPPIGEQVDEERGEPVRGVVNLEKLGVGPGERGTLETTLAQGPQTGVEDPEIERVNASSTPSLTSTAEGPVRG